LASLCAAQLNLGADSKWQIPERLALWQYFYTPNFSKLGLNTFPTAAANFMRFAFTDVSAEKAIPALWKISSNFDKR
jgi:hypothetical protein